MNPARQLLLGQLHLGAGIRAARGTVVEDTGTTFSEALSRRTVVDLSERGATQCYVRAENNY